MRALDGYPTSWGSSRASVFPHAGPASYAVMTYGPVAGGDTVTALPEAGMKFFDDVLNGVTDSGNFLVLAVPVNSSEGPTGQQSLTYHLRWIALRTAAIGGQNQTIFTEAIATTDLSDEIVRLLAVGPK